MLLKYSIGIDIASKDFQVCMVSIDHEQKIKVKGSRKFKNTTSGFNQFEKWYNSKYKDQDIPLHFCMEATGVYHENLAHFLYNDGQRISIILANLANKFLQSLGNKSKNDPIDSKGLAQMGAERRLNKWDPPVQFYATLRELTRMYQTLQEHKVAISNQLHSKLASANKSDFVIEHILSLLGTINEQVESVRLEITNHIDTDTEIRQKVNNLCTIKGVGELTVAVIISETYGFELFENAKQLISYAGYDVVENQSGNRSGKTRISKRGNSKIRRSLHFPAFNVKRKDQEIFNGLYERVYAKSKIKMKAYVAIQKKLLTTLYALWKTDQMFDPNYNRPKRKKVAPREVGATPGTNIEKQTCPMM